VTAPPRPTRLRAQPTSRRRLALALALTALLALVARPAFHHSRAAALLVAFAAPKDAAASGPTLVEERTSFDVAGRTIPARLYAPAGVKDAPAIVMVHGVHFRGMEEPRLERFARAVAGAGYVVMTPEVSELSDYRVAPASIETVGAAVRELGARRHTRQVGLMGMSFGGGIALLTAADPRFADQVAFVVAIGAHDDLGRVTRFFVTNTAVAPSGTERPLHAHEYGATVAVYARVASFFPAEDVPAARVALRKWLEQDREAARAAAAALSPASRAKVEKLFAADVAAVRDEIVAMLATDEAQREMRRMSPHENLAGLRANVFLLHGEGDTVIPATETQWLAADVPPARLRMALITPAIQHVELHAPSLTERAALVHFMGEVLADASAMR
jgi:dienelactone hydrolase